jgi:hypothetical protein
MSFQRGTIKRLPQGSQLLEDRLVHEFECPSANPGDQPIIVAEPPEGRGPINRLYVIWDAWSQVKLEDRSEIIVNAYVRHYGDDLANHVSVAMGLTAEEAKRLGMGI